MRFFQQVIARTYKDIWPQRLTNDNAYDDALQKLYRSRAEVSADRANIKTTLAIHEISKHVSAGHFDRAFIENIIGNHISEDGMAKIKDSEKEKLKALYCAIHDAWKYKNTKTAVDFWDQFRDCFCTSWKVEGTSHHAMVAVADAKKQRFPSGYSKAYDKKKVKSNTPGSNPACDPEAPMTSFQIQILSSKMGQMLKATEKLSELQT